jgi:general secretion pathway protein G
MHARHVVGAGTALASMVFLAGCPLRAVKARKQAQRAVTQAAVQQVVLGLELFRVNLGRYPTSEEGLEALIKAPADSQLAEKWKAAGPFLGEQSLVDAWKNPLQYERLDNPAQPFRVWSMGPDGEDGTPDDVVGSSTGLP